MRVLDLFSGIGGFSLGLESVGMRTIGFCEIEPFPRAVLAKHWPGVPIHDDVRTLSVHSVPWLRAEADRGIDLICGGFPCQDISVAGKGAGLDGHRSGLWSEYARLVGELRPTWVLAENVGALRTRGVDRVCSDLEAEGYTVWPLLVGAWAVGAPHKRERVWIVAHRHSTGSGSKRPRLLLDGERAASGYDADGRGERPVGDTDAGGLRAGRTGDPACSDGSSPRWPARPGEPQHEWEPSRLTGSAQRGVGELPHGLPERLVRRANRESLKALGNSVVPQVVEAIGYAILEADEELSR